MIVIRNALANPVAVLVAVLLVVLFGALSLIRLPVQLTPEVEKPEITITTAWRSAAPEEVESEIIEPQEKVLRGLPGMTDLLARARRGSGEVTITFQVGMDMQRALLEVLNRLNRVPSYPIEADEPVISSVGGNSRPIAWFMIKPLPGNDRPIASYQEFVEEVIQTRFERVPGVALSEVRGGREREVRISFDPYKAALLGVQIPQVARLVGGSKDVSGGNADVGKRRYVIRFAGKYDVDQLSDMVLDWRNGNPIRLRDIATVDVRFTDRTGFVLQNGSAAMSVNAHRETGVNVLDVMDGLKQAAVELRDGPLKRAGLSFEQVYDETNYIYASISMVQENFVMGVILAVGVLWWFLRHLRATLVIAVSIPIAIVATFIFLDATGRTLNVISLAGLAFAVGMVLDAAIVVLENIVRLRERGLVSEQAAELGATQVWTALFASTVTTVAVFLPVVFMREEAGQLFADLALTIAVSIIFSLVVAMVVLPTAANKWLPKTNLVDKHAVLWDRITDAVIGLTNTTKKRILWILFLVSLPIGASYLLLPKADYLPQGNRELVFAFVLPPPGINIDTVEKEIGNVVAERLQPYVDGKKEPAVLNYFFVVFNGGVFLGVRAKDISKTNDLVPLVNQIVGGFPDTLAFARRTSLFGGLGGGNTIDMDIQGSQLESDLVAAQNAFGLIREVLPGSTVRPFPGLDLADPELRLVPDERRIAEAGWSRADVGVVTRALGDGYYVGDYFDGEQRLDVTLRSERWQYPEDLAAIPLATPKSGVVSMGDLAHVVRTAGPEEIRRINRRRTITLQVTPPEKMSLEEAITVLREQVEPKITDYLPEDGDVRYSGTADKLRMALSSLSSSFLLAIVILFLLMAAIFRSFKDSLLALTVIPLATVGGVVALQIVGLFTFQPLDLLTMIGFIILLGLVVNNSILLVELTRSAEREGQSRDEAVRTAVRQRLRPILMSSLTTLFGMLPLVVIPGAGTELYRGMGAVIVGGMAVSTAFTLILLPALLRLRIAR